MAYLVLIKSISINVIKTTERGYWWTYQLSDCSSLALKIFKVQGLLRAEYLINQFCNQMSLFLRLICDALVLLGHILRTTTKTRAKLD